MKRLIPLLIGVFIFGAQAAPYKVTLDCLYPPTERTDGTELLPIEIRAYQAVYKEEDGAWIYAGTSPTNSCLMEILIEVAPGVVQIAMQTIDTEGRASVRSIPVEITIRPVTGAPPMPPVGIITIDQ
jgi:hypothetical protein